MGDRAQGVPAAAPRPADGRHALPAAVPLPRRLRLRGELRREGRPDARRRAAGRARRRRPSASSSTSSPCAPATARRTPATRCGAARRSSPSSRRRRPAAAPHRAASTAPSCSPRRPRCARLAAGAGPAAPGSRRAPGAAAAAGRAAARVTARSELLFNPDLRTAVIMIPGLCGIILVFVGTVATALGVVRERQAGTMEQLAVMPFRPRDVFVGKIAPYLLIAAVDMVIVVARGHAAVRRAVPRLGGRVRPRRGALPVRHARHRRAHLDGLADPGPGHPAGDDDACCRSSCSAACSSPSTRCRGACAGSATACR